MTIAPRSGGRINILLGSKIIEEKSFTRDLALVACS